MVGDPKSLSDLAQIDAAVRVECLSCRWKEIRDRGDLERQIRAGGGSTAWEAIRRQLTCPTCDAPTVRLVPLPYSAAPLVPRRRRECALLSIALQILDPYASPHRSGRPTGTLDVRLALRVVQHFLGASPALTTYWEEATASPRFANQTCAHPYFAMRRQLVLKGWDLDCKGVRWRGPAA